MNYKPVNDVINLDHFTSSIPGTNFIFIPCLEPEILDTKPTIVEKRCTFEDLACFFNTKMIYMGDIRVIEKLRRFRNFR